MPKYEFGDQENKKFELVPDGDYIIEVVDCEFGLAKKTGDDRMSLTVKADGYDTQIPEYLVFNTKAGWRIDTFVKSTNLQIEGRTPKKGESIEFTKQMVVGLRGWATVFSEPSSKDPTKFYNKIKVWLTDKEKLAKRVIDSSDVPGGDDWSEEVPF